MWTFSNLLWGLSNCPVGGKSLYYIYTYIFLYYIIISMFVSHTNMDSLLDLMNTSLPLRPCPNCLNQFCRSEGHQFFWENMLQWGILNSGWGCALVCSQNSNWAKNYKLSFCAQFLPSIIDKASLSSLRIRMYGIRKFCKMSELSYISDISRHFYSENIEEVYRFHLNWLKYQPKGQKCWVKL